MILKNCSMLMLFVVFLFNTYTRETFAAKKQLNILFITDKFPFSSRPFINNQIKGLLDRGHKIWVWCTQERSASDEYMSPDLEGYNWRKKIYYKKLPSKRDFHIILCQFGDKGSEALLCKDRGDLRGKVVTCFRGEDVSARLQDDPHRFDRLLREGDHFLPVCEYFKQRLVQLGAPAQKITVIHSAIDCDQFAYQPRLLEKGKPIELISVNRLTTKKGTLFSIMAVVLLKQKYPMLSYTIIGGGPLYGFFRGLISQLHATQYIKLVGKLPHHEVASRLKKAHIFLLPSVTAANGNQEGIPNVLMEALAVGLPVLSTHHAGIPELVQDGVTGLLVPERDIFGLMDKLSYLIEHPKQGLQMGKSGRAYVEKEHNMHIESDRLEQLLLQLAK